MIVEITDVDALAQIIRRVDGSNKLGAGALAEAILAALSPAPQALAGEAERGAALIAMNGALLSPIQEGSVSVGNGLMASWLSGRFPPEKLAPLLDALLRDGWLPPSHVRKQAERIAELETALRWYAGDGSTYDGIDVGQRARAALAEGGRDNG